MLLPDYIFIQSCLDFMRRRNTFNIKNLWSHFFFGLLLLLFDFLFLWNLILKRG